jgi:hypothetical protein
VPTSFQAARLLELLGEFPRIEQMCSNLWRILYK